MTERTLELEVQTIDDFKLYSTIALKKFLSIRKKNTVGSFETLVARAFSAYEEGCPVDAELEHRERVVLDEYKQKYLKLSLNDPFTIKNGWLGEQSGMNDWPNLYFMDISRYFANVISRGNL